MKTVLDLIHTEAKDFFLKEKSYFDVELPEYYEFQKLLDALDKELENRKFKEIKSQLKTRDLDNINYKILNNKDGQYAWRPFQLIHPVIYVSLVHSITQKEHWQKIKENFDKYAQNPKIECHSLPVLGDEDKTSKENQVYKWWHKVEQRSLVLALEYNHVLHLDISDCYGSLYTHSIVWALHTKEEAKKVVNRKNDNFIGNIIDWRIQDMSNGQTNGIPQGSVLMDFIAEIVLGYGDFILTEKIKDKGITDYKIIRYRDDYRIFTNSTHKSTEIAKMLSEVLSSLNFKVNAQKTISNDDLILGALKPDKIHWIYNKRKTENIQKWLLQLYKLGVHFPNSGTLYKEVKFFLNWLQKRDNENSDNAKKPKSVIQNPEVLISILINLAFKNPRLYPLVTGSVSHLITEIDDKLHQKEIIDKIKNKFNQLPNTNYLDLWLQRLTLKIDIKIEYTGSLCKLVNDESVQIWNSKWLNTKFQKIVNDTPIVNLEIIKKLEINFSKREIEQLGYNDKLFS